MQTTATLLLLGLGLAAGFSSGYSGGIHSYSAGTTSFTTGGSSGGLHAGDQHSSHDNCVEIIKYDDVEYAESNVEVCAHSTVRQCQPRSQEICQAVPVTRCELVGNTDCQESTVTVARQEGVTRQESFTPQQCQRGADAQLVETKEKPVCHTVTKQQCDSRWEVDPATGEKVWAGNINCRDVSWEDCSLVGTQVVQPVEQYNCQAGAAINYNVVEQQTVQHNTAHQVCSPNAELVCSQATETQCVNVEWEDCQDELVPNCDTVWVNKPSQQANHLLRCNPRH